MQFLKWTCWNFKMSSTQLVDHFGEKDRRDGRDVIVSCGSRHWCLRAASLIYVYDVIILVYNAARLANVHA